MTTSYTDLTRGISAELGRLRGEIPDTLQAFSALGKAACAEGALDKSSSCESRFK